MADGTTIEGAAKVHGIFMPTAKHAFSVSTYARTTKPTWEYNLRVAQFAEQAGFDYLLAGMRWSTQGGVHQFQGERFEGMTYMAALAASTSRVTLFPTIHSRIYHPLMAAKMIADIDRISGGRVGINIVSGLVARDNMMFGQVPFEDDEERLAHTREWLHVLKSAWTEHDFDFDGKYFQIVGSYLEPKPPRMPLIVKAGSAVSKQLVAEEGDWIFIMLPESPQQLKDEVDEWKGAAAEAGRSIRVCSYAFVMPRDTLAAAQDLRAKIVEHGYDRDFAETDAALYRKLGLEPPQRLSLSSAWTKATDVELTEEQQRARWESQVVTLGTHEFLGEPERIADELQQYLDAGLDGLLYTFWDYEHDLHRFADEVMPLLRAEQS